MRKVVVLLLAFIFTLGAAAFLTAEGPSIGVLRFTNASHWYWWAGGTGSDLQDMLASELASTKAFTVLERKEIDAVLGEQDLGASGRIDPASKAKIGKLKGAKYLVAATVSAFEEDTQGTDGGVSIKGISLGGKKERAYIAVDLKVIDTTTGEIVDTRTVEATSKSGGLNVGLHKGWFGGSLAQHSKTPVGKAIRACVIEIADYLVCSLTKGKDAPCMAEYNKKESTRREKTKKAIDLE